MDSLQELKEQVYHANMELDRRGLVLYTFKKERNIYTKKDTKI